MKRVVIRAKIKIMVSLKPEKDPVDIMQKWAKPRWEIQEEANNLAKVCLYLWTCRATASGSGWGSVRLKVEAWMKRGERVARREKRMQVKESILILMGANEEANNNGAEDMLLVWLLFTQTQIERNKFVIMCVLCKSCRTVTQLMFI